MRTMANLLRPQRKIITTATTKSSAAKLPPTSAVKIVQLFVSVAATVAVEEDEYEQAIKTFIDQA